MFEGVLYEEESYGYHGKRSGSTHADGWLRWSNCLQFRVTYSSAMELVTLSDDEMLTSVQNVAKALQESINKTDDTAKVSVEVDQDGKCILYASGRDEKGNATARQELCKADSVKAMFEIFYNNNWLDSSGNVKAVG